MGTCDRETNPALHPPRPDVSVRVLRVCSILLLEGLKQPWRPGNARGKKGIGYLALSYGVATLVTPGILARKSVFLTQDTNRKAVMATEVRAKIRANFGTHLYAPFVLASELSPARRN